MTDHLSNATRQVLDQPIAARLQWFQEDHWVAYDRASTIIEDIEARIAAPRTQRMRGHLVVGPSNNGKSFISNEVMKRYPMRRDEETEKVVVPVLRIQMPPKPNDVAILHLLLDEFMQPYREKDAPEAKRRSVVALLRHSGTRALLVDELEKLLGSNGATRRVVLDLLRHLSNEVPIPIIGFCTPAAHAALATVDELINRLHPRPLPRWSLDQDYRRLLAAFERRLPLPEPSNLDSRPMATLIHALAEGLIGETHDLLEIALDSCLRAGVTRIDEERLRGIDWVPPSGRKQASRRTVG